jgi:pilus assembly protein CpaE
MSEPLLDDDVVIAPVPRVTIQAFCENAEISTVLRSASQDRRMNKAQMRIQMGGAAAAVEAYRQAPTPNVLILEAGLDRQALLRHLDSLAEFCDSATKVIVIGQVNDVLLYRDLVRRGVSEYLVAPVGVLDLVRTISELYATQEGGAAGRTIAVVGAKGGTGASTIAHNLAWTLSSQMAMSTVLVDLDIAFGTAALDFNQDPPQGIAEAIFAPDRLDPALVDRLLSRCSETLTLMAAPATLERTCDLTETAVDGLLDILRTTIPCIVLDIPHLWTAWAKHTLIAADEIVIVCEPELASLRNAKGMIDLLRQNRPHDRLPKVVLNQIDVPKRPEITPAEFAKAISLDLVTLIPHDAPLFGSAANNGQMIAEIAATSRANEAFVELATALIGRSGPQKKPRPTLLEPILARLSRLKAS